MDPVGGGGGGGVGVWQIAGCRGCVQHEGDKKNVALVASYITNGHAAGVGKHKYISW